MMRHQALFTSVPRVSLINNTSCMTLTMTMNINAVRICRVRDRSEGRPSISRTCCLEVFRHVFRYLGARSFRIFRHWEFGKQMQTHVARRRRTGGQTDPAVSHLAFYVTVGKYKA